MCRKNLFFDMGSICAIVRRVHGNEMIECEVQNEGWIYENQTIVFERKKKRNSHSPNKNDAGQITDENGMLQTDLHEDEDDAILREDVRFVL